MDKNNREHPEIRVRGVGKKLREELNNISDNTGIPLTHIIIPKLHEIVESYPEKMRQPKKED